MLLLIFLIRSLLFRFEEQHSCQSWFNQLQKVLTSQRASPRHPPTTNHGSALQSLYPVLDGRTRGSVPQAIERCISHITTYGKLTYLLPVSLPVCLSLRQSVCLTDCLFGTVCVCLTVSLTLFVSGLKVEGVYRRCGLAVKVTQLVEALMTSPKSAPLESDEQGVLDASSALKQFVRQQESLIPNREREQWLHAAG